MNSELEVAHEPSELELKVQGLIDLHGHTKILLKHEDGMGEGIWATPVDALSRERIDNDGSYGEPVVVRLCNQPLGWCNREWGDEVIAETRGESRPEATISYQSNLEGYFLDHPPVDSER